MTITNPTLASHEFLAEMYADSYFPRKLVNKGRQILVSLCESIEDEQPTTNEAVYALTHEATERFNELAEEFVEQDSELETGARDAIALDFDVIAKAYGFELDLEEMMAPRDW